MQGLLSHNTPVTPIQPNPFDFRRYHSACTFSRLGLAGEKFAMVA
jgi:hypothetical protein